jgi:hypothetical protein
MVARVVVKSRAKKKTRNENGKLSYDCLPLTRPRESRLNTSVQGSRDKYAMCKVRRGGEGKDGKGEWFC